MSNQFMKDCPKCRALNAFEADFCRFCGTPLEAVGPANAPAENIPDTPPDISQNINPDTPPVVPVNNDIVPAGAPAVNANYNPNFTMPDMNNNGQSGQTNPRADEINGATVNELAAFVGDKANKIIPEFVKLGNHKSVSFQPVVFFLGILLSPIIGSFWFFHRKMNKIGAAMLAIGCALTIASSCIACSSLMNFINLNKDDWLEEFSYSFEHPDDSFEDYFEDGYNDYKYDDTYGHYYYSGDIKPPKGIEQLGIAFLTVVFCGILSIATSLLFSLFAYKMYLNFACKRIRELKSNTSCTLDEISAAGGTQSAVWIITLTMYIIASIAASIWFAYTFISTFIV